MGKIQNLLALALLSSPLTASALAVQADVIQPQPIVQNLLQATRLSCTDTAGYSYETLEVVSSDNGRLKELKIRRAHRARSSDSKDYKVLLAIEANRKVDAAEFMKLEDVFPRGTGTGMHEIDFDYAVNFSGVKPTPGEQVLSGQVFTYPNLMTPVLQAEITCTVSLEPITLVD